MGNVMSMGYASPSEPGTPIVSDDYIERLPAQDLRRYTEGFRRVCRAEPATNAIAPAPAASSARRAGGAGNGEGESVAVGGGHPPLPSPPRPRQSATTGAAVSPASVHSGGAVARGYAHGMKTSGALASGLSKKLFRGKLLSAFPLIPHSLSDRLFEVLDSDERGELSVENVLRGLALLKHGSREEHVQLLFTIYDLDNTGLVSREVMGRFMDVIYGRKKARHASTVAVLQRIFGQRSTLTPEEFAEVVHEKNEHGEELLVQWLGALAARIGCSDESQIVELEKQYNPVVIRHRIAEVTHFSTNEVAALEKQFHNFFYTKGGASNRIAREQFVDVLARNEFPRGLLTRVCQHRAHVPGMVLFDEFCRFLSEFCRGTIEERCAHLFAVFHDQDDTGGDDLKSISDRALVEFVELCSSCVSSDEGTNAGGGSNKDNAAKEKAMAEVATATVAPWGESSFVHWAQDAPVVHQLLRQLAFAGCLLFGIKPDTGYLERRIIKWQWQRAAEEMKVGQSWNFIAAAWWHQWCRFVDMNPLNGTPAGVLPIPPVPANAVVASESSTNGTVNDQSRTDATGKSIGLCLRPGPVANWSLLKRSGSRRLKDNVAVGRDFYVIPSSVYSTLTQWYSGGPDLCRTIVERTNESLELELFPLVLRIARVDTVNGGVIMSGEEVLLSRLSTVDYLLEATCKALLLTKHIERARLWFFDENHPDHKYRLHNSRTNDLSRLNQNSVFLLEIQDEDGSWPLSEADNIVGKRDGDSDSSIEDDDSIDGFPIDGGGSKAGPTGKKSYGLRNQASPQRRASDICSRGNLEVLTAITSSTKNSSANGVHGVNAGDVAEDEGLATARTLKRRFSRGAFTGSGLVGLDNLGNTCYMSSALQCMSHTRLLVDYFKNEDYLHDINLHNRDGANGKLAVAFGELLRVLWTSEKKRFAPTAFKRVLSRFNSQFLGSDQHDAQELLACLLSGLSEDLNRIVTKPYTQQPDSEGRSDAIVADEWWQNHLKREVSVIVALFTGQYKSLLECSVCHYESARFEPFTFLQLSLPESNFRSVVVTVIFNNGHVPMKYSARVPNDGTVQDVVNDVARVITSVDDQTQTRSAGKSAQRSESNQPSVHVVVARISSSNTVEVILDNRTPLSRIHERDHLTAFHLDPLPEEKATTRIVQHKVVGGQATMNGNHSPVLLSPRKNGNIGSPAGTSPNSQVTSSCESDRQTTTSDQGSDTANEVSDESLDKVIEDAHPLPVGTSVFVRTEKPRDFLPARVIGGSSKSHTVDVAYPTGVRRYHIPQSKVLERTHDDAYVFLVHRRVERSVNSFTEAHITRLFGAPLTLRVSLQCTTQFDLYMLVWRRLHRIFNWQTPPSPDDIMKNAQDMHNDTGADDDSIRTNISTMALGSHLPMTHFGFCLRMVTSHGIGCSRCEWIQGCLGCVIVPSPSKRIQIAAEETISIDWDIRTLKEEYDPIQASKLDTSESVESNHRLDNMPLNINRCLDIFTAEENIQEAYCGRCKAHRPATKTMDLWRLPPILVIQLKRFCFTQVSRRKLHHFVDFPLTGLRLEDFVAKKREPKRMHESGLSNWLFLGGKLRSGEEEAHMNGDSLVNDGEFSSMENSMPSGNHQASSSLLDAPATAAERAGDSFLYDLYAVVNHVGALGGGHYFAYILSEDDKKWKCFNDHQCKDIDAKDVVSSAAYILFYRRRDMRDVSIEDLFPPIRRSKGSNDPDDAKTEDQVKVEELVEQTKQATNSSGCTIS